MVVDKTYMEALRACYRSGSVRFTEDFCMTGWVQHAVPMGIQNKIFMNSPGRL